MTTAKSTFGPVSVKRPILAGLNGGINTESRFLWSTRIPRVKVCRSSRMLSIGALRRPEMSVSGGDYEAEQTVTITSDTSLYFTDDRTEPTTASTPVTGDVTSTAATPSPSRREPRWGKRPSSCEVFWSF